MFRITIEEVTPHSAPADSPSGNTLVTGESVTQRYLQTVDQLDVPRIIAMINTKPRTRRGSKKVAP